MVESGYPYPDLRLPIPRRTMNPAHVVPSGKVLPELEAVENWKSDPANLIWTICAEYRELAGQRLAEWPQHWKKHDIRDSATDRSEGQFQRARPCCNAGNSWVSSGPPQVRTPEF